MIWVRAASYNVAFYLWTGVLALIGLPVLLGPRRIGMAFGRFWSAGCIVLARWIVGLDYEVRGRENLPDGGGAIVAMKHQSAWDTLVLPVLFGDPAVVLKRELMLIPLYGWYARHAGAIPVDRRAGAAALRRMVADARRAAAEGRPIVIFPEGTRTAVGARKPYQPGVAALYGQLDLPLVPVAVNSGLYWGRRAFLKRPGRIVVEILPPIPPGTTDRRAVLKQLEARIEEATARLVAAAVGEVPPPAVPRPEPGTA
jgi:1-acyl-sn-glycerol-3-phosphate acyltransferase